MPYLDIELMTDLASTLKSMGIKKAFTAKAEFEDFANYRFAISKILQKSRIILNVKGCESASTTVIVGETANLPGEKNRIIAADHPFIFSIYEKTSGAILFIGQKVK